MVHMIIKSGANGATSPLSPSKLHTQAFVQHGSQSSKESACSKPKKESKKEAQVGMWNPGNTAETCHHFCSC